MTVIFLGDEKAYMQLQGKRHWWMQPGGYRAGQSQCCRTPEYSTRWYWWTGFNFWNWRYLDFDLCVLWPILGLDKIYIFLKNQYHYLYCHLIRKTVSYSKVTLIPQQLIFCSRPSWHCKFHTRHQSGLRNASAAIWLRVRTHLGTLLRLHQWLLLQCCTCNPSQYLSVDLRVLTLSTHLFLGTRLVLRRKHWILLRIRWEA